MKSLAIILGILSSVTVFADEEMTGRHQNNLGRGAVKIQNPGLKMVDAPSLTLTSGVIPGIRSVAPSSGAALTAAAAPAPAASPAMGLAPIEIKVPTPSTAPKPESGGKGETPKGEEAAAAAAPQQDQGQQQQQQQPQQQINQNIDNGIDNLERALQANFDQRLKQQKKDDATTQLNRAQADLQKALDPKSDLTDQQRSASIFAATQNISRLQENQDPAVREAFAAASPAINALIAANREVLAGALGEKAVETLPGGKVPPNQTEVIKSTRQDPPPRTT